MGGMWLRIFGALSVLAVFTAMPAQAASPAYAAGQRPGSLAPFLNDTKAAEMELALTAAPASVSSHATVMTLGRNGYELARKGDNGFVCMVDRSWTTDVSDVEFWNSRVRQPACYNPAAVRSVLPTYLQRTRWVLAGATLGQIDTRTRAAAARGAIRPPEQGAMVFMTSRLGYLGDALAKHPHPHLMFFMPKRGAGALGANQPGVPIFWGDGNEQPFVIFFVQVPKWSDGTPAPSLSQPDRHGEHPAS
jgi:hypothetical protein